MVHESVPAPTQQQSNEPWLQQAGTATITTEDLPEDIEPKWLLNKGLHICHLNVHYLYPKLDEIKILLHEQNIDILCLCQTFLNQEFCDDELKINGYDFIRKDRQTHGGGLIIYMKSYLSSTHHVDLETNESEG